MTHHHTTIRAYRAETDLEPLSALWLAASLDAHAFIGEERLREQRGLIEAEYLPKAETWVACLDATPVGFISLLGDFVGGLFVAPNRQGLGIGQALIAHALSHKDTLRLEVYTDNQRALAFYERIGFREVSRRLTDDEGLPFENAQMVLNG